MPIGALWRRRSTCGPYEPAFEFYSMCQLRFLPLHHGARSSQIQSHHKVDIVDKTVPFVSCDNPLILFLDPISVSAQTKITMASTKRTSYYYSILSSLLLTHSSRIQLTHNQQQKVSFSFILRFNKRFIIIISIFHSTGKASSLIDRTNKHKMTSSVGDR